MSKTAGMGFPDRRKYLFRIAFVQLAQLAPDAFTQACRTPLRSPHHRRVKEQHSQVRIGRNRLPGGPYGLEDSLADPGPRAAENRRGDLRAADEIPVGHAVAIGETVDVPRLEGIHLGDEAGEDGLLQPAAELGVQPNSRVNEAFRSSGSRRPPRKDRPVLSDETMTSAGLKSMGSIL